MPLLCVPLLLLTPPHPVHCRPQRHTRTSAHLSCRHRQQPGPNAQRALLSHTGGRPPPKRTISPTKPEQVRPGVTIGLLFHLEGAHRSQSTPCQTSSLSEILQVSVDRVPSAIPCYAILPSIQVPWCTVQSRFFPSEHSVPLTGCLCLRPPRLFAATGREPDDPPQPSFMAAQFEEVEAELGGQIEEFQHEFETLEAEFEAQLGRLTSIAGQEITQIMQKRRVGALVLSIALYLSTFVGAATVGWLMYPVGQGWVRSLDPMLTVLDLGEVWLCPSGRRSAVVPPPTTPQPPPPTQPATHDAHNVAVVGRNLGAQSARKFFPLTFLWNAFLCAPDVCVRARACIPRGLRDGSGPYLLLKPAGNTCQKLLWHLSTPAGNSF